MPDPKPDARIVDPTATRRKVLGDRACRACGNQAATGHHLLPKGERGDDVVDNIVPVCGDGTQGCHGALHGSPYVVQVSPGRCECGVAPVQEGSYYVCRNAACDGYGQICLAVVQRRDSEWVRRRLGAALRHGELCYLVRKLGGAAPALAYLRRHYYYAGSLP